MTKRRSTHRLTENEIAKVRELRSKSYLYADIGRIVGCTSKTARAISGDIPFTSFERMLRQQQRLRSALRAQAFIDACNRALATHSTTAAA